MELNKNPNLDNQPSAMVAASQSVNTPTIDPNQQMMLMIGKMQTMMENQKNEMEKEKMREEIERLKEKQRESETRRERAARRRKEKRIRLLLCALALTAVLLFFVTALFFALYRRGGEDAESRLNALREEGRLSSAGAALPTPPAETERMRQARPTAGKGRPAAATSFRSAVWTPTRTTGA